MRFNFVTAGLALVSLVSSAPATVQSRDWADWSECLSQATAENIVTQYISILSHPDPIAANATAQALLTDDYQEISDSILSLEGLPLGGVTFSGKQVYINGVLNSAPVLGVNTLEVLVAGCTKIIWYWKITGIGSQQYPIKGFNLFTITPELQIQVVDIEFNSIAWGLDTGYQVIFPTGPPPTK